MLKVSCFLGVILAVSALWHGIFELLQGNQPTPGYLIEAIGPEHVKWKYGTADVFSLIPNFMLSGIVVINLSIITVFWSIFSFKYSFGSWVFLLLFLALTLTGGGMVFIPFYLLVWGFSTRINKSLSWWKDFLPERFYKSFTRIWPYSIIAVIACWFIALAITIWGYYPGKVNPEELLTTSWSYLFLTFVLVIISFVSAICFDINATESAEITNTNI